MIVALVLLNSMGRRFVKTALFITGLFPSKVTRGALVLSLPFEESDEVKERTVPPYIFTEGPNRNHVMTMVL